MKTKWQQNQTKSGYENNCIMSFIKMFNYHGNQRNRICLDCNFCLFTKRNKIIQKMKWFLLIEKDDLLEIRGKGLHFCITELVVRPNCSDYL